MFKKPRRANSALVAAQEAIDGVASRRVDRDLPNPMHNGIDRAISGVQSEATNVLKNNALELFTMVKSQLGTFAQSSDGLTRVLDDLGKLHPFILIAVIPFKTALTFELKRRENDKKVVALFVQMNDMMTTLRLLEPINPEELGPEGGVLAQRMDKRLREAADVIQRCSHDTNEYYHMKFISKLVKGVKWEAIFTSHATSFSNLGRRFKEDLQIYTGTGVQAIHRSVGRIEDQMAILMNFVFRGMASPEEQELQTFMNANGGADNFIEDDKLLLDLIRKREAQMSRNNPGGPPKELATQMDNGAMTSFAEIKSELKRDLDTILAQSRKHFDQKFEEQKHQIAEVKTTIKRESDRIIQEIKSGAHDRILDRVLYTIWVEMGWKGSVKARHLVLALRDFYVEQLQRKLHESSAVTHSHQPGVHDRADAVNDAVDHAPMIANDEEWAVAYINTFRLRPLVEALDPDCSEFVTIYELNEFTSTRPASWSLTQWLAYWTVGFEVTLRQYCYRIRAVFSDINSTYRSLLPGNAEVYSSFISSWPLSIVDQSIAGILIGSDGQEEDEYQHPSFQEYDGKKEQRFKRVLSTLGYLIDDKNSLLLITGSGRLEEYFLPLVYLLLRQALRIIEQGQRGILARNAFSNIFTSLRTLWLTTWDRTRTLQGIFRLRNVSVNDELRKYSYGLYYYLSAPEELDKDPSYYNMPDSHLDPDIDLGFEEHEEDGADYFQVPAHLIQDDEIDLGPLLDFAPPPELDAELPTLGMLGQWYGFSHYGTTIAGHTHGVMGVLVDTLTDDGKWTAGGSDSLGMFFISGTVRGKEVNFTKRYPETAEESAIERLYEGVWSDDLEEINGRWRKIPWNGRDEWQGIFKLQKRPEAYVRIRPFEWEFEQDRIGALWKFARTTVMEKISRRYMKWSTIKARRDIRRRFIVLFNQYEAIGLEGAEATELRNLGSTQPRDDLRFYRALARRMRGREVIHNIYCDNCSKSIIMTRYMCMDCSHGRYIHTINLCVRCVDKEFTVTRDNGAHQVKHRHWHPLLQIRRPFPRRQQYTARENARITLRDAPLDAKDPPSGFSRLCYFCQQAPERPYWSCCECLDVVVCSQCNAKTEEERPWIYERRKRQSIPLDHTQRPASSSTNDSDKAPKSKTHRMTPSSDPKGSPWSPGKDEFSSHFSPSLSPSIGQIRLEEERRTTSDQRVAAAEHHWSHDLVLCPPNPPIIPSLTIEERLSKIEEKLENQDKLHQMENRLGSLERLLTQLVEGRSI